jgi:BolA family transcriptional regulator, general stress-responsive regulator
MSMQQILHEKLSNALQPTHLEVENESHQHNVPSGSESHFRLVIASDVFAGKTMIACHRAIYDILQTEMSAIHALTMHTYTPAEWDDQKQAPQSPPCLGGNK